MLVLTCVSARAGTAGDLDGATAHRRQPARQWHRLTLTQQPSGETYAPCVTTDADGRCHWQVPGLRLGNEVVVREGFETATGDAGLRGLGVRGHR